MFATGFLMLYIAIREAPPAMLILSTLAILMFFAGGGTPPAMAAAIHRHPNIAGTASGLSGAIGLIVGGCFTMVSGALYDGGFGPAALLMFAATSASAASLLLATRPVTCSSYSV
jgi:nitrate/nitrite transporter NarK